MTDFDSDWRGRNLWTYRLIRGLISLIVALRLVRVDVAGEDHVPDEGPVILMINHQSNLDPVLVGWATRRPLNMPAKIELFRIPVLRTIMSALGSYPVDRNAADTASLRRSLSVLRAGRVLGVFPEGTRSRSGEVGPFAEALTRLAVSARAQMVPVAISGSGSILPPGRRVPRIGARISIRYGLPVVARPSGSPKPGRHEIEMLTKSVRDQVVRLLQESDSSRVHRI